MKMLRTLATAFAIAMGVARAADASSDAQPSAYFEGEGYRGHIGKAAVVMRLAVKEGRVSGHYFYEKMGRDIAVRGTFRDSQFDLVAGRERMSLRSHINGAFEGTWLKGDRSLEIAVALVPRNGEVVAFKKREEDVVRGFRQRHEEPGHPLGEAIRCIFHQRFDEVFGVVDEHIESRFNWNTYQEVVHRPGDCDTDLEGTNTAHVRVTRDGLLERSVSYNGLGFLNMAGWWGWWKESAYDLSTGKRLRHRSGSDQ